jgi:hypothetical protein
MNTLKSKLAILVLLLSIAFPVFAQDETEVPKATEVPTAEATPEATAIVEPEPTLAEPVVPNETVDVQTWVDDVLEYLSNHTGEIILGVGLLLAILRIKQPMTSAEKEREAAEIARQREEARLTPEPIDDLIVSIRELIHGMRRMEDALPTAQRASTASGDQTTVNVFTDDTSETMG